MNQPLPNLKRGQAGIIAGIDAAQPTAKRLADLGFVSGIRITMVRPGKPCIVRIDGRFVGLGASCQQIIRVVPN